MPADLLIRLVWTAAIISLGLLLYRLVSQLVLARANHKSHSERLVQPGIPAILYFTTPDCVPCRTVQRPALRRLQTNLGDRLQIVEINAQERPDLAREWGVLSVPTTFLLDASGKARHVNHGATPAEKLLEQLKHEKLLG